MRIGSLFSGAGGLDMAVLNAFGGEVAWHCELDPAASKVLEYRWPGVPNLRDISAVDWSQVDPVDVLCGGFPCQDISSAGKQAGMGVGTRSGLWSEFARAIDELRPSVVVIENVRNLLSVKANRDVESDTDAVGDSGPESVLRGLGAVLGDLSDIGYDAQWTTIAASSVGAPHRRERVFIVASDTQRQRQQRSAHDASSREPDSARRSLRIQPNGCGEAFTGGTNRERRPDADTTRDGRDEGWPESAGIVGGSDAAVCGDGPVGLLPTPTASDASGGKTSRSGGRIDEPLLGGIVRAHATGALLPTPTAQSAKHDADDRGPGTLDDFNLWSVAARIGRGELLPTPRSSRGASTTETSYALGGSRSDDDRTQGEVLLPTPNAQDGNGGRYNSDGHQSTLPGTVRELLPTPRSSDCFGAGLHGDGGMDLRTTVTLLPTPKTTDLKGTDSPSDHNRHSPNLSAVSFHTATERWGKYAPAIARWELLTRPAPAPTEPNTKGNPRLAAAFSEWLMGWPAGHVTEVPGISRNDQLRIIGNGVVVLQAITALQWLLKISEVAA